MRYVLSVMVAAIMLALGLGACGGGKEQVVTPSAALPGLLCSLSRDEAGSGRIAFSPDGTLLASKASDATVAVWDVAGCRVVQRLSGDIEAQRGLGFNPDGSELFSADDDNAVTQWDIDTGEMVRRVEGPRVCTFGGVETVVLSPAGSLFASGHYCFGSREAFRGEMGVFSGAFRWDSILSLWDPLTGERRDDALVGTPLSIALLTGKTGDIMQSVDDLAFASDGSLLVIGADGGPYVWRLSTGEVSSLAQETNDVANCVAISSDGRLAAAGDYSGTIRLWEIATGRQVGVLTGHEDSVEALAFSPDGTLLASGGMDDMLIVWDVPNAKLQYRVKAHRSWFGDDIFYGGVSDVAFSPDGSILASSGGDGVILLWDTAQLTRLAQ
jgi:WD40 repeat protein